MIARFICPRGHTITANAQLERVGHWCRKSYRPPGGRHAWTYATREDLVGADQ